LAVTALVAHQRFLCALKAHFGIQNALLMRIKSAGVLPGGLALAALALVVFGAIECPPPKKKEQRFYFHVHLETNVTGMTKLNPIPNAPKSTTMLSFVAGLKERFCFLQVSR